MHNPAAVAGLLAFAGLVAAFAIYAGRLPAFQLAADDAPAVTTGDDDTSWKIDRLDERLTDLYAALDRAQAERRQLESECNRLRVDLADARRDASREDSVTSPRIGVPAHHDAEARLFQTLEKLGPVYEVIGRLRAEIVDLEEERRRLKRFHREQGTP